CRTGTHAQPHGHRRPWPEPSGRVCLPWIRVRDLDNTDTNDDLQSLALPSDSVGLLEGLVSTRAIRRYRDEPVPDEALRAMLFAATRGPTGSNRQPFRFLVLSNGPKADAA